MALDAGSAPLLLVSAVLTLVWVAALFQAATFPTAAFGTSGERVVLLVLMVVLGWIAAVMWFTWYRGHLQDELNRRSPVDL